MEPLIFIFILYIIYSLVVPGVALGRSKRAEQKAEDALRKAEDALRKAEQKAEDALHRLSKIQEGDLVAGELQPEKVVDSLIAEDLPPVAEIVSVRSMVTYPVSMAFTLWVREREKLSLHWARGQSPAVADGIQQRFTDPVPAGKKVITPASGSSGKKDPAHLPPVPAEGERRPAASAPTGRESGVEKPAAESIEMKLGTYWFVRIGVLLLLTGAGILAFYNRQFFIDLAPVAKVSCLYLLSGLLGGIGFWLQHTRETLRNYGQVLVAGGFSGVYFTTYAAHIFEPVKVIADPTVTLLLLLAWGGFMAWVANRLRSETVALFAVGAAYYATYVPLIHVNSGGVSHWVILASNVILAATAVAFMLRNRWFKMPLLSMSAAYAGFVLWRVRVEDPAPLLIVLLFAASLWIIYNAAVFLSRHDAFDDRKRAAFLTANNAALFGFLTW
ncbi:MAG: DUF2339 domain-containing protein, partial [Verrucomicrobiales bacterium]|nr:DUF2339 domain-containing protein [Verrucomicrobiales bacterium]